MSSTNHGNSRPWGRAAAWLLFLGPFFYVTYGFSNWLASQREQVAVVVFDWEIQIPFVAWTIIPYWSLSFFYAASVFVCASRRELTAHVRRLLTAQVVAVSSFILFPLQFSFLQPPADGLSGLLFELLGSFDKPYNQAPSLHIALVVILWHLYAHRLDGWSKWLLNLWFLAIGATVLTTYQHHFIDLPTGALLGWLCVWLWPLNHVSPVSRPALARDRQRRRLARYYALGGVGLFVLAFWFGGGWLWLVWPAISVSLVALFYFCLGRDGFQKRRNGRIVVAARWLLAPYLGGAWINSRLWTWGKPPLVEVADGVWLGRFPSRTTLDVYSIHAVVDLSAELSADRGQVVWQAFPCLDLTVVPASTLCEVVESIVEQKAHGRVLVCCALGYSRSAAAVCCWLVKSGHAGTLTQAVEMVGGVRPDIVLGREQLDAISVAVDESSFRVEEQT